MFTVYARVTHFIRKEIYIECSPLHVCIYIVVFAIGTPVWFPTRIRPNLNRIFRVRAGSYNFFSRSSDVKRFFFGGSSRTFAPIANTVHVCSKIHTLFSLIQYNFFRATVDRKKRRQHSRTHSYHTYFVCFRRVFFSFSYGKYGFHFISLLSIIKLRGNTQQTALHNCNAVYTTIILFRK